MGLRDLFRFGRAPAPPPSPPPSPPPMTSRQANEMLVSAVEANDLEKAEIALKASGSANLTCQHRYYFTAHYDSGPRKCEQVDEVSLLWLATIRANEPMVRLLLSYGAAVDAKYHGRAPLMHAVAEGATPMVRALLDGGASLRGEYSNGWPIDVARNKQYADII
ncbi:MAG: ankyrin repeat domain-containing protein, partial [Alphaproteobacteria bacterium]